MPRDRAFGDLIGKLGVLRIECAKCGRSGKYRLARLIAKYGRDEKLFSWTDKLTADCPRSARGATATPAARFARTCRNCCEGHGIEA